MARNKIVEGTIFAVPLETNGFAVGLVARASKRGGVLLGYFWGKWDNLPELDSLSLTPQSTALVAKFGDLFLSDGKWPILGELSHWRREEWPMPLFVREEPFTGRRWEVKYSDDDPNALISEVPAKEGVRYLPNLLHGAGAMEIVLNKHFSNS